jgi:hypothetical protein
MNEFDALISLHDVTTKSMQLNTKHTILLLMECLVDASRPTIRSLARSSVARKEHTWKQNFLPTKI